MPDPQNIAFIIVKFFIPFLVGSLIFFSLVVAPTTFINLDQKNARVFIRKIFQEHIPISLGNRTTRFANVTNSGKTLTINLGETLSGTLNFNLTHNIKDAAAASKTKGIHTTEIAINTTDNNGGLAGPWNLGVPDAFELLKVYVSAAGSNSTVYASGSGAFTTDRTDKFEILDGQKDGMYAISIVDLT